ncbi:MAG: N-6 DNA methylase [Saprospiraceae bacterium]
MSEELLQRDLQKNPEKLGKWDFYNIGATSVKALKKYGIIRNVNYGKEERKKVDALIVQQKNVIAVIEYKKPSEFKTKAQKNKAIKQEIEVAKKIGANIIIATDTKESVWVNVETGNRIKDEDGKELKYNFNPKDEKLPELIEKIVAVVNINNDQLIAEKYVNPTDLARKIWQIVWSITGATPESCLYSFVELFIFKYLSDLEVLQEPENFDYLFKLYKTREPEFVIDYYARNIRRKIKNDLFPKGDDGTTIINGTVFVNNDDEAIEGRSTAFEKILREFDDYGKLDNIHPDFKSQLFESFLKESISKKNWGQFFTPLKVVKAIVEMAKDDIQPGIKICDPAGGVGKFLLEAIEPRLNEFYAVKSKKLVKKLEIHGYDIGFDKDEQKTIILAKANMLIYFSDLLKKNRTITEQFANLFNDSFELKKNSILGTLAIGEEENYELILSNPPYVTSGSSNIKEEIKRKGLSNYYKINAMGVEGLFMEWIVRALKPNGKAFIVVPDGIFNRQNDKNLRQFIIDECFIDSIISLPAKTFFTTPKKTYILAITKKVNKKDIQSKPVFTYLVSEIGESRDVYRFDINQNDLQEAVKLYRGFKGSPEYFIENNTDDRCKIQSIDKFKAESNWSIERWWSKEEKIALGIVEEDKSIKLEELPYLLDDVATNILSFKDEILSLEEKKNEKIKFEKFKIAALFEILGESNITRKYLQENQGEYPVYSGQTENKGLFGYLNTFKYNYPVITWATYGVHAGTLFLRGGEFNIGRNACGLKLKKQYETTVSLDYVTHIAEAIFKDSAKGAIGTHRSLPQTIVKTIEIELPIDEKGNIDLNTQIEIVEKFKSNFDLQNSIEEYKNQIEELNVEISLEDNFKLMKIKDIFDLTIKTNNSKFTKSFINKNKGNIPVYSASKFPDSVDYGYVKDNLRGVKYFEDCLTWNIDGSIGKAHLRKGRFSLSEKVIPFKIKESLTKSLDIYFLKYQIEKEFRLHNFGFDNKAGKGKIQDIAIQIPLTNGAIDLDKQKMISNKYQSVQKIKEKIGIELSKISNIKIDYL